MLVLSCGFNCLFRLVSLFVDIEPTTETVDAKFEHTLKEMPGNAIVQPPSKCLQLHPCLHLFNNIVNPPANRFF